MNYSVLNVGPNTHLDIPPEQLSRAFADHLLVLRCAAGSTVTVPTGFASLWWCIRGRALALSSESHVAIDRHSILVSDSQRNHCVSVQASSDAIALVASQSLWSSLISYFDKAGACEPAVFPALHSANRKVCKPLLQFLRLVAENKVESFDASKAVHLAITICELQRSFSDLIAKCPGPSLARRRTVFLRLQRVRNHLSHCIPPKVDVAKLALTTNYSVWRFIRVYYSVFGETPYSHITRCREDRAKRLLETGAQCIGDIAVAVGFENGSSLTRAIKRRYGVSPTEIRQAKNLLDAASKAALA